MGLWFLSAVDETGGERLGLRLAPAVEGETLRCSLLMTAMLLKPKKAAAPLHW